MKRILIILISLISLALMYSCEEDQVGPTINLSDAVAPTITSPANNYSLVLSKDDEDLLFTIEWTESTYNMDNIPNVTYSIIMSNPVNNKDITLAVTDALKTSVTYKDLNTQLTKGFNLPFDESAELNIKVVASITINTTIDDLTSSIISVNLTPYEDFIEYPVLYVPGSYQGWSPSTAPTIASLLFDGNYEGYVNFPNENTEFKFTSHPDWNHENYGYGGDGVLDTDHGAGNLSVAEAGYYKFNVNTNNLTWTYAKTTWGIIGSAVPPYDWSEDVDMIYNADEDVWEITLDLEAGEFKFRANHSWDINYGYDVLDPETLTHDGNNIPIEESGNYTITLILNNSPIYVFELVKN